MLVLSAKSKKGSIKQIAELPLCDEEIRILKCFNLFYYNKVIFCSAGARQEYKINHLKIYFDYIFHTCKVL
ncbi:hypothetical protein [Clostridium pasteurianum]|uniref:hypothetical protein n=1 Tax=Clostridium pasteurianum TaxID=1501 RepID=UPI0005A043A3|nr:hypothetical protein [Clostridium pasteurianum]